MSTIGIDPSVVAPAFAIWPSAETWQEKTTGEGPARLLTLSDLVCEWMTEHAPADLEAVFIERPVGRFPKRALDHACGVIQAAVQTTARTLYEHPLFVVELSPGEWKLHALGNGAAKKNDVAIWAIEQGADVIASQDEHDALAIAFAGATLLATERSHEGAVRS